MGGRYGCRDIVVGAVFIKMIHSQYISEYRYAFGMRVLRGAGGDRRAF